MGFHGFANKHSHIGLDVSRVPVVWIEEQPTEGRMGSDPGRLYCSLSDKAFR